MNSYRADVLALNAFSTVYDPIHNAKYSLRYNYGNFISHFVPTMVYESFFDEAICKSRCILIHFLLRPK